MKFFLIIFFIIQFSYSQNKNTGQVIEYNKKIEVEFSYYSPPKKIDRVDKKEEIDYSSIEGLLQSYISATNLEWAKEEYINSDMTIVRDSTHFNSIKNSTINDYIQLENIYNFKYYGRNIAFVRYSQIYKDLPFPFISILSIEKANNRWYISILFNQNSVYFLLRKLKNEFIVDVLKGSSSNNVLNILLNQSTDEQGNIMLEVLSKNFYDLRTKDKASYNQLLDEKQISEMYNFRNAEKIVSPISSIFSNIYHPFVFDNFRFNSYENSKKSIILNEASSKKYKNKPELLLLSTEPIYLLNKITIKDNGKEFYLIKFKKNNKIFVEEISLQNKVFIKNADNKFDNIKKFLGNYNSELLGRVFSKKLNKKTLDYITTDTGSINIDLFIQYLKSNKEDFNTYLER